MPKHRILDGFGEPSYAGLRGRPYQGSSCSTASESHRTREQPPSSDRMPVSVVLHQEVARAIVEQFIVGES